MLHTSNLVLLEPPVNCATDRWFKPCKAECLQHCNQLCNGRTVAQLSTHQLVSLLLIHLSSCLNPPLIPPSHSSCPSSPLSHFITHSSGSGAWRTEEFKEYNFNAMGAPTVGGNLHPLMKVWRIV